MLLKSYENREGFIFVSLIDDTEIVMDQFTLPLSFFEPFRPITLEVTMLNGQATFYCTLALDLQSGLPKDSLDNLVNLGLKWIEFETLPSSANYFSIAIAKSGLPIGSEIPRFYCDTRDDQSFSRAFF